MLLAQRVVWSRGKNPQKRVERYKLEIHHLSEAPTSDLE